MPFQEMLFAVTYNQLPTPVRCKTQQNAECVPEYTLLISKKGKESVSRCIIQTLGLMLCQLTFVRFWTTDLSLIL